MVKFVCDVVKDMGIWAKRTTSPVFALDWIRKFGGLMSMTLGCSATQL